MKDIKPFLCSREECIKKVQKGIDMYSKKELAKLIDRHEYLSILQFTSYSISIIRSKIGKMGDVYFVDEIDPMELTKFAILKKGYKTEKELIYSCICRRHMRLINEFYSELNQEGIVYRPSICGLDELYVKKYLERKNEPHKRLRGKA